MKETYLQHPRNDFSSESHATCVHERTRDEFQIFAHARVKGCAKILYDLFRLEQSDACVSSIYKKVVDFFIIINVAVLYAYKKVDDIL